MQLTRDLFAIAKFLFVIIIVVIIIIVINIIIILLLHKVNYII